MRPYYEEDGITIYHDDVCNVISSLSHVDLVLADPPYGIGFAAQPTRGQRRQKLSREDWDNAPVNIELLTTILSLGDQQCVWGGNYYPLPVSRGWLAWTKPDSPPSMGSLELAWTNVDRCARHISYSISATNAERVGHPTQKPLAVMLWTFSLFRNGKTVLDPFCGSGTTLVAAKELRRQAIGVEINERYCEIAAQRLSQGVLAL